MRGDGRSRAYPARYLVEMSMLLPLLSLTRTGVPWPQGSTSQLHYLDNELSMFMHYSVCTYNDGCNGGQQNCAFEGKKQPWPASSFDPSDLDTNQWAETARDLGARQVCLTVHHTGAIAHHYHGVCVTGSACPPATGLPLNAHRAVVYVAQVASHSGRPMLLHTASRNLPSSPGRGAIS